MPAPLALQWLSRPDSEVQPLVTGALPKEFWLTITIQIEAKGSVQRLLGSGETNMIAQVTFGLDISIFLVINLHFSKSWQEQRQIA